MLVLLAFFFNWRQALSLQVTSVIVFIFFCILIDNYLSEKALVRLDSGNSVV